MSTLWLVATPIGNLSDLTPRAIETLERVALVCCEDTRRTGLLLRHAGIRAERLAVCNEHTEIDRVDDVLNVLSSGADVAVVSDAGTPGISDPGHRLVTAAIDAGHDVVAVPGASAVTTALVVSGLPTDRFVFEGFLPRKGRERAERLADIAAEVRTTVIYESPKRVDATLDDLRSACGPDRRVSISRELTKLHEETVRGTLGDVGAPSDPRGEFVIVIGGRVGDTETATDDQVRDVLRSRLDAGASTRDAAAAVAAVTGRAKREVYALALGLRSTDTSETGSDTGPDSRPDTPTDVAGSTGSGRLGS